MLHCLNVFYKDYFLGLIAISDTDKKVYFGSMHYKRKNKLGLSWTKLSSSLASYARCAGVVG